jgi:hypothetical protein
MTQEKDLNTYYGSSAQRGVGLLARFTIPLVLMLAASVGVSVWVGIHIGSHEINQVSRAEAAQQRADDRTGAHELPKAPIKLVMYSSSGCLKFDSGYLDGGAFTGYIKNSCHDDKDYYKVYIYGLTPDGTVVQSRDENTSSLPLIPAVSRVEMHMGISGFEGQSELDDRVVEIKVKVAE